MATVDHQDCFQPRHLVAWTATVLLVLAIENRPIVPSELPLVVDRALASPRTFFVYFSQRPRREIMFMHRLKHDVLAFLLLLLLLPALVRSQVDRSTGNRLKMTDSDQAFYKVIIDCSLFRPLGWRPPDTRPKYQLMATKIPAQGPAKAMIKESRSSQIYYLGVGDKLQLTKVEKIETNQVSLSLEGKLIALKLNNLQFLSTGREKRCRGEKTEEGANIS